MRMRKKVLFTGEKDREENKNWQLDIEEGIILNIDKYYLSQAIDNLIINSINYAKSGTIAINLKNGIMRRKG